MFDSEALLRLLPHRPPFLFVDEVLDCGQARIITRVTADPQADFFKGHYPGNPVMPGVLLCECCFQAGALLIAARTRECNAAGSTPVITRIRDARFKRMIKPGDRLQVEVEVDEELNDVYFMTGRVKIGDQTALRVEFAATLVQEQAPHEP